MENTAEARNAIMQRRNFNGTSAYIAPIYQRRPMAAIKTVGKGMHLTNPEDAAL